MLLPIYITVALIITGLIAYDLVSSLSQLEEEPDSDMLEYYEQVTIQRLVVAAIWPLALWFALMVALVLFMLWAMSRR